MFGKKKKGTRLAGLEISSVDVCDVGANQEAHMRLAKRDTGTDIEEDEALTKRVGAFFMALFKKAAAEEKKPVDDPKDDDDDDDEDEGDEKKPGKSMKVDKSASSFAEAKGRQDVWRDLDTLCCAIREYTEKEVKTMIKARDAIAAARALIGTPYSELDCINLIKKVIRDAPGGVSGYTTAGTNALWDSISMSKKYRDLTERHEGLHGIPAGALPFKRYGADDEGHVGIATGEGTVIHSSSAKGKVVETPLTEGEGWDCWGVHRYIETGEASSREEDTKEGVINVVAYKARVKLNNPVSSLNVRNEPSESGDVINQLFHGQSVTVLANYDGWMFVQYGDSGKSGYVSGKYLERVEAETDMPENVLDASGSITIVDSAGNRFTPVGDFKVLIGGVD